MGGSQSHLYIYLNSKENEYTEAGCTVKPTKAVFNGSIDFEFVTYTIKYIGDSTYFDIYIYDSKETVNNGYYIFAYCSPSITSQVAKEVKVYYSVLAPSAPLVISFVINTGQTYDCDIDKLKKARWDWAAYITEYTITGDLLTNLKEKYKKLSLNKTIELVDGTKETKDVKGFRQEIGDGKKNYRIVYIPNGNESVLNSNCLFSPDTKFDDKNKQAEVKNGCKEPPATGAINQIDPYYLTSVKEQFFDGIMVYFAGEEAVNGKKPETNHEKNTALYLEFIDLRKKDVCFKRKDKAGCFWVEDKIDYKNDTELVNELKKITEGIKDDVNTVIIDEKKQYFGATVTAKNGKQAYTQYTHKYKQENKLKFIFGKKESEIPNINQNSFKTQNVQVYYLKAKDKEDEKPFLISFEQDGDAKQKKAYHFKYGFGFKEWKEFEFKKKEPEKQPQEELKKELENKLDEIENNGSCSKELNTLQFMAYQILTTDKPPPGPSAPPPKKEKRPDLYVPDPTAGPLNLWLIIGCVVAGVVLLVALVVGYGVYWYNTTIKLLT